MLIEEELTEKIIGAAIEVHRALGPGLLESTYEKCLALELQLRGLSFKSQVPVPIRYKSLTIEDGYRLDLLVEEKIIVELKAVDKIMDIHKAQLLSYMRLMNVKIGLLLNFHVPILKDGITRMAL